MNNLNICTRRTMIGSKSSLPSSSHMKSLLSYRSFVFLNTNSCMLNSNTLKSSRTNHYCQPKILFSTAVSNDVDDEENDEKPKGDLFHANVGKDMLGKYASIKRVFGPRSNSQAMLTHGGPVLARHSSFDPAYSRAKLWIRHHPVGPALISPVLVNGIIGALVEAAVSHSVPISSSMKQIRPLIVGVEMEAKITVLSVIPTTSCALPSFEEGSQIVSKDGFEISLLTSATRVRDDAKIAEGEHKIWVADYMHI